MSTFSAAFCSKCTFPYDTSQRKMCTGTCNHSMCELCLGKQQSGVCPICETDNAFNVKNINYQAMGILEDLKKDMNFAKLGEKSGPENYSGMCSECKTFDEKLRVCTDCLQRAVLDGDVNFQIEDLVSIQSLEHFYLVIQKFAICADCFIDNKLHEGHEAYTKDKMEWLKLISKGLNMLSRFTLSAPNSINKNTEQQFSTMAGTSFMFHVVEAGMALFKPWMKNLYNQRAKHTDPHEIIPDDLSSAPKQLTNQFLEIANAIKTRLQDENADGGKSETVEEQETRNEVIEMLDEIVNESVGESNFVQDFLKRLMNPGLIQILSIKPTSDTTEAKMFDVAQNLTEVLCDLLADLQIEIDIDIILEVE